LTLRSTGASAPDDDRRLFRKSMIDFRLYLVTDRHVSSTRSLGDAVSEACRAGVRAVQLREKDLDAKSLYELGLELRRTAASHDARLLINDRVDIAMAVDADGIHCPEDGFPPVYARRVAGKPVVIGASTHSLERALEAEKAEADFITFGPVFETPSKTKYGPPQGLETLRQVASAVHIPVFAIGGITPERAKACIEHGARGIAVVSAVLASTDIARTVGEFAKILGAL
jgi:thiamine-phosphate pyrophosphorylase